VALVLVALIARGSARVGSMTSASTQHLGGLHHFGIHRGEIALGSKKWQELVGKNHVLMEGNRAFFADDDVRVSANRVKPIPKLFGVGNSGTQRDDLNGGRKVNNDFLPDRSAKAVGQVVDFIHHHVAEVFQQLAPGIEHVAQHFRGHDDHLGPRVNAGVTGQQAHPVCAIGGDKFAELLVRERFHGGGVKNLHIGLGHRDVNSELGNNRFPGTRRGSDQDPTSRFHRFTRTDLKRVQIKGLNPPKPCQQGVLCPRLGNPVALRGGNISHSALHLRRKCCGLFGLSPVVNPRDSRGHKIKPNHRDRQDDHGNNIGCRGG